MTEIRLHNTRTRTKEVFAPLTPGRVGLYLCGPTVYDRAHLGNARNVILFDVLTRLLRHEYGVDNVTYVRNITDVDDKINARAAETGRSIGEITEETVGWYRDDMAALGNLPPDHEPRATEWIGAMIEMIEDLIARGHAYEAEDHVLFAVESFAASDSLPGYGALSGRSIDDMIAGARVEVAPYKRNPMDFVLWKPSDAVPPGWDSPWGRGRPGWHIECSAMSRALLGESFDIHGGGNDLMFPHHENERAQSLCAHPGSTFANVWLHNEMLLVEGKKMSKSLGNFFTVRDLLDQGVPGEVIRFVFLMTHYRKPMDWTDAKRAEAEQRVSKLAAALGLALGAGAPASPHFGELPGRMRISLTDDLNTSGALFALEGQADLVSGLASGRVAVAGGGEDAAFRSEAVAFLTGLNVLGLLDPLLKRNAKGSSAEALLDGINLDFAVKYALARQTSDFADVDRIKQILTEAGVEVKIGPAGITFTPGPNFDETRLEALK